MKNAKTTRKALLSSVVALVLCLTMLMGTTFAWFTDTAKVTVNKITAGTLTIEVKDAETDKALTELSFKDANNSTAILWEPGATFKTNAFYVENTGNLALKFKVVVSGIEGDAGLLKVIDFKLVRSDDGEVTEEVSLGVDDNNKTSANYYITGTMDANADNDYQGMTLSGIEINIYATQDTVEYDSETNQYDVNAEYYNTFEATTAEELAEAFTKAESGDNIIVNTSIENGLSIPSNAQNITITFDKNANIEGGIEIEEGAKDITFVGANNFYLKQPTTNSEGFGTLTVKDSTIAGNALFKGTPNDDTAKLVVENCTFVPGTGNYAVYDNYTPYASVEVRNCVFQDMDRGPIMIMGSVPGAGDITVDGCTFINCTKDYIVKSWNMKDGATLTFTNNTLINCPNLNATSPLEVRGINGADKINFVISGNTRDGVDYNDYTTSAK